MSPWSSWTLLVPSGPLWALLAPCNNVPPGRTAMSLLVFPDPSWPRATTFLWSCNHVLPGPMTMSLLVPSGPYDIPPGPAPHGTPASPPTLGPLPSPPGRILHEGLGGGGELGQALFFPHLLYIWVLLNTKRRFETTCGCRSDRNNIFWQRFRFVFEKNLCLEITRCCWSLPCHSQILGDFGAEPVWLQNSPFSWEDTGHRKAKFPGSIPSAKSWCWTLVDFGREGNKPGLPMAPFGSPGWEKLVPERVRGRGEGGGEAASILQLLL